MRYGKFRRPAGGNVLFALGALLGATIPVIARFSIGGGDPNAPDAGKGPRGMGLEFRFAEDSKQHMTMINAPMFVASVPKTFLDNLLASKPDPATGKPTPPHLRRSPRPTPRVPE